MYRILRSHPALALPLKSKASMSRAIHEVLQLIPDRTRSWPLLFLTHLSATTSPRDQPWVHGQTSTRAQYPSLPEVPYPQFLPVLVWVRWGHLCSRKPLCSKETVLWSEEECGCLCFKPGGPLILDKLPGLYASVSSFINQESTVAKLRYD